MKTSPFVRIKNKNLEIKSLKEIISNIAIILKCDPNEVEIVKAIVEQRRLISSLMEMGTENETLKKDMSEMIADRVEKETFNLNLDKVKLQDKVENLQKLLDNKTYKINDQKQIISGNKKGFWDFLYKLFNL